MQKAETLWKIACQATCASPEKLAPTPPATPRSATPASRKAQYSAAAPAASTSSVKSTTLRTKDAGRKPSGSAKAVRVMPCRKWLIFRRPASTTNEPKVM